MPIDPKMKEYGNINNAINDVLCGMNVVLPYCLTRDDLRQAAWLRILKYLNKYNSLKGNIYSYCRRVAKSAIVNELNKCGSYRWNEINKTGRVNFERFNDYESDEDILGIILEKEKNLNIKNKIKEVKRRIRSISELHLKCFESHFESRETVKKIAENFDITYSRAKTLVDYSSKVFRRYYKFYSRAKNAD